MRGRVLQFVSLCTLLLCAAQDATAQELQPLPTGVLLVPGAVASASDRMTPVPEASRIVGGTYHNDYFGLTFRLPPNWIERYDGPPPSDSGAYVLAELVPSDKYEGAAKGTVVITAQDTFFSLRPAGDAMATVRDANDRLASYYRVERAPVEVKIADHSFARFDYRSPAAELHWYVLATVIRCHAVQFVFTSRDAALLDSLVKDMENMKFAEGEGVPVCVADYASEANITYKVDPVLQDHKFNPIPVRIIINQSGRVKHVHVISAFAEQARIVTEAVLQWRFKPYVVNGQPVEVETGIMFGKSAAAPKQQQTTKAAAALPD